LARAMRQLCSDDEQRTRYGRSAAQRLVNDFSASQWCNRLAMLYQRVLNGESFELCNPLPSATTQCETRAA